MQKLLIIFQQKILLTLYYILSETIFFLHGKKALLDKTYAWQRLCWTKPIPGIGYVGLNLFLAQVMLDKTFSLHR